MTTKPTLLILAAGMASRYGSLKQVDSYGPNGENIIDYSIYDAIKAGFGKVVFIIREQFEDIMRENFDAKLAGKIDVEYVYQEADVKEFGFDEVIPREKPWGTGHAVLAARKVINEPFCVINADDFYGSDAFTKMADFLSNEANDTHMALMGFEVGNTLSENGTVSRGVCEVNAQGHLQSVTERTEIYWRKDTDAKEVVFAEAGVETLLDTQHPVSMNFWGFTPRAFAKAETLFKAFVASHKDQPKSEFYIPTVADELVKAGEVDFKVIPTSSKWFGVTYKEDKAIVQASIRQLIAAGIYPERLY